MNFEKPNKNNSFEEEKEKEKKEDIRKFDLVEEFKGFLFENENKLRELENEVQTEKGGEAENKRLQQQIADIKEELGPYDSARDLLNKIQIKEGIKEENKGLLRGGELEDTNAYIDKDIAELNSKIESMVVRKKQGEEEKPEAAVKVAEEIGERGPEEPAEKKVEAVVEEVAEAKEKVKEELKKAREKLVEVEVLKKKYEGFKGLFKSRGEKGKIEEEYEQALKEYQEVKAEYMEDVAEEKIVITNLRAEQFNKEKGFGKRFYDGYKKLGNYNVEALLKKTSWGEKFVQKINTKSEGSKLVRLFKGTAKTAAKILLRGLSLRTAISGSLVGIGILSGGGIGLVGATLGRKIFMGLATGVGTYDLLKMGGEMKQDVWGLGKNLDEKEIENLKTEELVEKMAYFEQRAENTGDDKFLKRPAYEKMGKELSKRYAEEKAKKLEGKLDEFIKQTDQGLDKIRKKEKRKDTTRKVIAAGVGIIVASGVLGKLLGKKKPESAGQEAAPKPEQPPAPETPPIGYQGGKNIWHEGTNQLKARMGATFDKLDRAQKTYLIDNFKDKIVNNPEQYGLPKGFNVDKISPEQLQNVKWGELFRFKEQADFKIFDKVLNLKLADKVNILENNRLLVEYATKTHLPIETANVDKLVEQIKNVGGVDQFLAGKTTPDIGNVLKKASGSVARLDRLLSQQGEGGINILGHLGGGTEALKNIAGTYGFSGTKSELFIEYLKNRMGDNDVLKALISRGGQIDPTKIMSRLEDFEDTFSLAVVEASRVLAGGGKGAVKEAILGWGQDMGLDKSVAKGFFKYVMGIFGKEKVLNILKRDPGKIADWYVDFKG